MPMAIGQSPFVAASPEPPNPSLRFAQLNRSKIAIGFSQVPRNALASACLSATSAYQKQVKNVPKTCKTPEKGTTNLTCPRNVETIKVVNLSEYLKDTTNNI